MACKKILITGANQGIGLALAKNLACVEGHHIFLGSRNEQRGREAVDGILSGAPEGTKVELVVIDVGNDDSVKAAASAMTAAQHQLYAIVNNAGAGLAHGVTAQEIINTNYYGPKRVNAAFMHLLQPDGGRLVGTSSGLASGYVSGKSMGKIIGGLPIAERAPFKSFDCTIEQIDALVQKELDCKCGETEDNSDTTHTAATGAYGLSKAALTAIYMAYARENPKLVVSTCSPGFIATSMTAGFGASLAPEEGIVSLRHCILADMPSTMKGWYYGSDGKRSPLDYMRNPGEPEFEG